MSVETRFLEPLDVLFLRGNKLFGDPGSYGESLVPPWPSVAAGAIRSRMLADARIDGKPLDLAAYACGEIEHPTLGTPEKPGPFTVIAFQLARRLADGRVEALYQVPADLVVSETAEGKVNVRALTPTPLPGGEGLACSAPLPLLPVLAETERGKPAGGYWLAQTGWVKYLTGETPPEADLVKSSALWQFDPRVGVGLDATTGRADDGRLFSVQAVAMVKQGHRVRTDKNTGKPVLANYDVGFLAAIAGAVPPASGMVRLGGDGRAVAIHSVASQAPEPDYTAIARTRRCRLVLATPGIFPAGWRLPGSDAEGRFHLGEVRGRLACAAVTRAEIVSGWNLAAWSQGKGAGPKPAHRAAPAGSVYWLDELDATPEALRKLVNQGLWREPCEDAARRAEGFNRVWLATWN
jgi:CRISPR-associated protein Cmr3